MFESKLWHKKTETKNVKVAKMVEFIKTCDQYSSKFNFWSFFQFHNLPLSAGGKKDFQKTLFG